MNYKEAVRVLMTITVILNRAESKLVAKISKLRFYDEPAVGRDHRLYCKAENFNSTVSYRYRWKINNETIIESSTGRYDILYNSELVIKQITKQDKYITIQCQIELDTDQSEFSPMVVLNPRYGPSNITITPTQETINVNENKRLSLSCSADCRPQCIFTWYHLSLAPRKSKRLNNGKNMEIIYTNRRDAGTYICQAYSPDSDFVNETKTKHVKVFVNYGPDSVRIYRARRPYRYDVIEGKTFSPLNCTADCFPKCTFKWRINSNGHISDFQKDSVLNFNTIQRNLTGIYRCVVKNKILNMKNTLDVSINVHYGPGTVTVKPFRANITLTEGSNLDRIRCSAECGTRCAYSWTKDSRIIQGTYEYIFGRRVKLSDMGKYTCYVRNLYTHDRRSSISFVLNILHGPKNTRILLDNGSLASSFIRKKADSTIENLHCSADCNPDCNYTWTSDNHNYTRNGQVLSLGTATLDKNGRYLCIVENNHGKQTKGVELVIEEYGIKLSNSSTFLKSQFAVVEGSPLYLECHAKCKYRCYRLWYIHKYRQYVYRAELQYPSVERNQAGKYDCYDFNERDVETLQVIVQYSPTILYTRLIRPYRNNDMEIKKGSELKIECHVDSVPAANITWRKSDNQDILTSVTNMSFLVYSKEESDCEDLGTYICEAQNGIGDAVYSNITVLVRCPPHLTPQKRRKMKSDYKRRLGSNVMFTTEVRGYPQVKARWFYKYNHTTEENVINPTENNTSSVDGVFSLHIGQITEEDYGIYLLELSNEEGNLSFTFALKQSRIMVLAPDNMGSTNNNRSGLGSFIGGVVAGIALLCLVVIALVVILMKKRANSQKELSTEPEGFSSGHFEDDNHHFDTDGVIRTNECGNMAEDIVYDNTTYGLKPNSNIQDSEVKLQRKNSYTYAQVQKRNTGGGPNVSNLEVGGSNSDTYAEVQKQTNTAKPLPIRDGQVLENDQEIYANVEESQTKKTPCTGELGNDKPAGKQHRDSGKRTNKKGADRKSKPKQKSQSMNYIDVEFQSSASETSESIIHGVENRTLYSLVDFTKHAEPLPESEIQDDNVDEPKFKTTEEGSWC